MIPTKNVMITIGKNTQRRISESNSNSAIFADGVAVKTLSCDNDFVIATLENFHGKVT